MPTTQRSMTGCYPSNVYDGIQIMDTNANDMEMNATIPGLIMYIIQHKSLEIY